MNLPVVIEATDLHQHLSDSNILIIDLSSEENYAKAHIPGAIHLPPSRLLCGCGPIPNKRPTDEQITQLCRDIGLTPETLVVAYDDQMGPWAGRLMWTLNIAGHDKCSVLNGQLNSWLSNGFTTEAEANQPIESDFSPSFNYELIADKACILNQINTDDIQIWDARSKAEFDGEKIINAQKGGHIPGAKHLEWTDCLISSSDLRLKPVEELRNLLHKSGLDPEQTIVTHCQTHRRSGLTYLVARYLEFKDIRCYDGSWFEWGNLTDTPVEK